MHGPPPHAQGVQGGGEGVRRHARAAHRPRLHRPAHRALPRWRGRRRRRSPVQGCRDRGEQGCHLWSPKARAERDEGGGGETQRAPRGSEGRHHPAPSHVSTVRAQAVRPPRRGHHARQRHPREVRSSLEGVGQRGNFVATASAPSIRRGWRRKIRPG